MSYLCKHYKSIFYITVMLLLFVAPASASNFPYPLGCNPSPTNILLEHYSSRPMARLQAMAAPASIDWSSSMPNVGDQGNQNSCTAWATGYAYKSYQEKLEHGWSNQTSDHQFSPSYIYNQINGGVDNGSSFYSAFNLIVAQGVDTLHDCPYYDWDYTTQPTSAQRAQAAIFKAASWDYIGAGDTSTLKAALTNGPIVAGTKVYYETGWTNGGEINASDAYGSSLGNHAICIVGYNDNHVTKDGTGAFKFINSWGSSWGYSGYGWISYEYAQEYFNETDTMTDIITTPNPDLIVQSAAGPTVGAANGAISVTDSINNQGSNPAGAFYVKYYLEDDTENSSSDIYLGQRYVASLAAGVSSTATTSLLIPSSVANGDYYLKAVADATNLIVESDETNNTGYATNMITITTPNPDLIVQSVAGPTVGVANGAISVTDSINNQGSNPAGAFYVKYYLEDDTENSSSDIYLGQRYVASLAAGVSSTATTSLLIPSSVANGDYYLKAVADATNLIVESDETNNTGYAANMITINTLSDFTYTVTNGKTQITGYTGAGGVIAIPSILGGFPVTSIGDYAFNGCDGLTTISIPQGVTRIGMYAFYGCRHLTSITVAANNLNYTSINGVLYNQAGTILIECPGGSTSISIPQTVTSIGEGAFIWCGDLTSISIPQGVTSIGWQPFYGCTGLTSIAVAANNLNYASIGGVLYNKAGTILIACPAGLTTISIPQTVTSIGDGAFGGCTGLTGISIPPGVTSIGDYVFDSCGLTSISIPQAVTSIGEGAFGGCDGLTSIQFNSSTTTIYDQANTIRVATKIIGYNPSTAKDYAKKYSRTFEVIGTVSSDATLIALTPNSGSLNPAFAAGTLNYTVSVANSVSSIKLTPTVNESHATVKVNGVAVASGIASGAITLAVGVPTAIPVVITAQNGTTTKTYTVTVTRAAAISSDATLRGLTPSAGSLTPAFTGATLNYTVSVANNVGSIKLTPTVKHHSICLIKVFLSIPQKLTVV